MISPTPRHSEDDISVNVYREGLIYMVRGSQFPHEFRVILKEIATATQCSTIFNEICTLDPPKQGKLLRSLSPWKIYTRKEKRGSGICRKNILPPTCDCA